jgi:hypothetical protein
VTGGNAPFNISKVLYRNTRKHFFIGSWRRGTRPRLEVGGTSIWPCHHCIVDVLDRVIQCSVCTKQNIHCTSYSVKFDEACVKLEKTPTLEVIQK